MNLLIFAGLAENKLISKLSPLVALDKVEKVYLVRNSPVRLPKIQSVSPPFFLNILGLREFMKFAFGIYLCLSKKIDYIIGIFLKPHGLFAHVLGKIFKRPVIQLFVGNEIGYIARRKKWLGSVVKDAEYIGVRGSRSRDRLAELLDREGRSFIHRNLYTHPNRPRIKTEEGKEFDIIFVAHHAAVKRIDIFFRVLAELTKKHPQLKAGLVGEYKTRHRVRLMRWMKRLGIQENIEFIGPVKDVFPYLYRSRIFMLTSETEGLPMALIEAMSIGLPCIVPDVGDLTDFVVNQDNALVVQPLDIEGFARSALLLLDDQDLYNRLSERAAETIQEREKEFSLEHIKEVWDKILT